MSMSRNFTRNIRSPQGVADGYYGVNVTTDSGRYYKHVAVVGGQLTFPDGSEVPLWACSEFSELPASNAAVSFWRLHANELDRLRARVKEFEEASAVALDALRMVAANIRNELVSREVAGRSANQWPDVLNGCVSGGGVEEAIRVLEKAGVGEEKR